MASFGSDEQREIDPTQQVSRDRADAALTLAERLLDKGNSVFQVSIAQMYVMLKFGSGGGGTRRERRTRHPCNFAHTVSRRKAAECSACAWLEHCGVDFHLRVWCCCVLMYVVGYLGL